MKRIILSLALIFAGCLSALAQGGLFPQNQVYAGPTSGGAGFPNARALVGADLPNPSGSTLGGVESLTCAAHQWLNTISISGVPACAQPAFTDISGSLACTQHPALTGFVTASAGSCATLLGATITIAQGGTGQTGQTAAFNALAPTPTRAGDIIYWNGSTFATLAGNNSGTQILTENASGVASWAASGSVSSVTCGTGLSGGTITTSGTCAVSLSNVTNSLSADMTMNVTANYFDGPSTAQGTSGTWLASGGVTVTDTGSGANVFCKLWDGTTVIDSRAVTIGAASQFQNIALHGVLAAPAANIKISCRDTTTTTGVIKFNSTGNSKDSTLTVFRIQ